MCNKAHLEQQLQILTVPADSGEVHYFFIFRCDLSQIETLPDLEEKMDESIWIANHLRNISRLLIDLEMKEAAGKLNEASVKLRHPCRRGHTGKPAFKSSVHESNVVSLSNYLDHIGK